LFGCSHEINQDLNDILSPCPVRKLGAADISKDPSLKSNMDMNDKPNIALHSSPDLEENSTPPPFTLAAQELFDIVHPSPSLSTPFFAGGILTCCVQNEWNKQFPMTRIVV